MVSENGIGQRSTENPAERNVERDGSERLGIDARDDLGGALERVHRFPGSIRSGE